MQDDNTVIIHIDEKLALKLRFLSKAPNWVIRPLAWFVSLRDPELRKEYKEALEQDKLEAQEKKLANH